MIIGVVAMIVIHEGGHFVAAKAFGMKATEAFFGFGPRLWSTKRGETEYGIKAIPLGGYVRIIGMNPFEEVPPEDETRTYRVAKYWKKTVVVLAGISTHFVIALVLLWVVAITWGVIVVGPDNRAVPTTVVAAVSTEVPGSTETSPSLLSGVMPGDRIVSTNGVPVVEWQDFATFAEDHGGETVEIGIVRDGVEMTAVATLATRERDVVIDGEQVLDEDGNAVTETVGFFGVSPEPEKEFMGPISAIPVVFDQFGEVATGSVVGLGKMVVSFPRLIGSIFGASDIPLEGRPISPVGLVQNAGPLEQTLQLLALVNIFVGVLNFVPLYPLDGGHFAVATYEKVTGREPNIQKLIPVAAVVFMFLVSLSLVGLYLDIFQPGSL